ncbi:MAG: hypothetical protein ACK4N5_10630, partial [Myxococcales bacterium]
MLLVPVGTSEKRPKPRWLVLALIAACTAVQLGSEVLRAPLPELAQAVLELERAELAILRRHGRATDAQQPYMRL